MAYLTREQALARLSAYGMDEMDMDRMPTQGDLMLASYELDSMGPFIGTKLATDGTQTLAFPRNVNPDGTQNTSSVVPDPILDWVVHRAYMISIAEKPALTSRSARGISESFASPFKSPVRSRLEQLERVLVGYFLKVGQSVDTRPYSSTPERDLAS